MNRAPRPVLIVRGTVWRQASLATVTQRIPGAAAAQLADPVEDHHRVVDRVADDGEEGGEEDPVHGSLPSQANMPSSRTTSWNMATTAAAP